MSEIATTEASLPAAQSPDINQLIQAALTQGESGVAALERLVALKERTEDRDAKRAYNQALISFQRHCPTVPHSKMGDKATYTELHFLCEFIAPYLADCGLSYTFDSIEEDGRVRSICTVLHEDGYEASSSFTCRVDNRPNKGMTDTGRDASAWSFARRYALVGALGIRTCSDNANHPEDDDGYAASTQPVSEEQAREIEEWVASVGADESRFLGWVRKRYPAVDTVANIPAGYFDACVAALKAKQREAAQ